MPNLFSNTLALVGGAAAGAVAMYLLDPDLGADRRRDVHGSANDAVTSTRKAVRSTVAGASDSAHSVANTIGKYAKDLAHQAAEHYDDARDGVSHASDSAHSVASRIAGYAKELAGRVSGHVHDASDYLHDSADDARKSVRSAQKQARAHWSDAVSYGRGAYKQAQDTRDDWAERAMSFRDRARAAGRRALGMPEPRSHTLAATGITAGTVGVLVVGAGLMYFFDPQRGRTRRAMLRDRVSSAANSSGHKMRQYGEHLGNVAQGYATQARNAVPGEWVDKAKSAVSHAREAISEATGTSTPSPKPYSE